MRIACVRIRDAPLAALVRREPELRDKAVVVVDISSAHGRVVTCTERARKAGVVPGQTVHCARAIAPGVIVRVVDGESLAAARAALVDAVASVVPRIEPDGDQVYLDASEVRGLYRSEAGLVSALVQAARRVGLEVDVGIASTKTVARLAASRQAGGAIVPEGQERAFLSPLPIDVLPLSSWLRIELARLGVRTVGALAALPMEATGTRLGSEAACAIALARGEDPVPLLPRSHVPRFEEAIDLDWEITETAGLVFVLRRLVDALVARLACCSLAAAGVTLSFTLVSGIRDERTLAFAAPSRDGSTLLHILRASLEARPPVDAVVGVRLSAIAAPLRPVQLGLFDPPGPAPEKLALTLARLVALVGEGRVGAPHVPDTHRPHAVSMVPFEHRVAREAPSDGEMTVALHRFCPPRAAEVVFEHGRMVRVHAEEISGMVRTYRGPFRVKGEWWGQPFDHDDYDVELSDGGLYLIGFDRIEGAWCIEGMYE